MIGTKRAAWYYVGGTLAALFGMVALIEGPVSSRLADRDKALVERRAEFRQPSSGLTEDRVRMIVRDEMKEVVGKEDLLMQELGEIRRMLPQKLQAPARNAPRHQ